MTETGKRKFAINLNKQLQKAKITQSSLALRTGVVKSTVTWWLQGKTAPRGYHLPRIATCLGCRTQDLLKGIKKEELLWLKQIKFLKN